MDELTKLEEAIKNFASLVSQKNKHDFVLIHQYLSFEFQLFSLERKLIKNHEMDKLTQARFNSLLFQLKSTQVLKKPKRTESKPSFFSQLKGFLFFDKKKESLEKNVGLRSRATQPTTFKN